MERSGETPQKAAVDDIETNPRKIPQLRFAQSILYCLIQLIIRAFYALFGIYMEVIYEVYCDVWRRLS